jgi:hypothetical protein
MQNSLDCKNEKETKTVSLSYLFISITSGNNSENITISREVLNKTEAVGLQDLLKSGKLKNYFSFFFFSFFQFFFLFFFLLFFSFIGTTRTLAKYNCKRIYQF